MNFSKIFSGLFLLSLFYQGPCQTSHLDVGKCMGANTSGNLSEISNHIDYIRLSDFRQSILIGKVYLLTANINYIVIYDDQAQKLFLFDNQGQFLRILMRQGRGPHEFIGVNSIDINLSNEILVLKNSNQIEILNPDGTTIQEFEIPGSCPVAKWLSAERIVVIYPFPYYLRNNGFEISFFDKKGNHEGNALPNSIKDVDYNNWAPAYACGRNQDTLYYWNQYRDTIMDITKDMRIISRIIFKHSNQRYPIKEIKNNALVNGKFNSNAGYLQNSYREFKNLSFLGFDYRRTMERLVFNRVSGIGYSIRGNQTTDEIMALKNNLDGGPGFWPRFVTWEGDLIMVADRNEFRETFLKNRKAKVPVKYPAQQDSLQKYVIDKITVMDNPILIKIKK